MVMGKKSWHKADGARCRRHTRHRQGAGVCAFCLRERLSHLSPSAALPSVVREEASSCSQSEASSTMYSSTEEGSSGASSASGSASPGLAAPFHQEMRRAARLSLLMRHERVVVDSDEVVCVMVRRRERTSFWAKLLHATRRGGNKDGCSSSSSHSMTLDAERSTATKWILF